MVGSPGRGRRLHGVRPSPGSGWHDVRAERQPARKRTLPDGGVIPGLTYADRHILKLPPNPPAGKYELEVGLYRLADSQRLTVQNGDSAVRLTPLKVRDTTPPPAGLRRINADFGGAIELSGVTYDPNKPGMTLV